MCAKTSIKNIPFELRLERLQEIVGSLEQGKVSLADSIALYKEGLGHTQQCREELEKAHHEIKILSQGQWEDFGVELASTDDQINSITHSLGDTKPDTNEAYHD